jgi:hypothetical protein
VSKETHGVSKETHGVSKETHGVSKETHGVSKETHGVSKETHIDRGDLLWPASCPLYIMNCVFQKLYIYIEYSILATVVV